MSSSRSDISRTTTIENDEAIARALALEEQERADAELAARMHQQQSQQQKRAPSTTTTSTSDTSVVQGQPLNCPGRHGLQEFLVSYAQRVECNVCHRTLHRDERAYGCVACNFDVCETCFRGRRGGRGGGSGTAREPPATVFPPPSVQQNHHVPAHMCVVPCVIGHGTGVAVEMMVDTGAQTSVISTSLAQELGLADRIDRRHQGVAAGVGRARIVGKIRNVLVELGHVEFPMDFAVLDATDKLLLLGLDLMRQYKCIVDLESNKLVFGGQGGVEVHMLPPEQQHVRMRNQLGCPMM
jgi:hypothetical protein